MAKRPYEQRLRAEAAEETRERVLDALYDRLREGPSQPVSVDEISRRARVARSTVYLIFGSRDGLFDALTERMIRGPGYARIVEAVRLPDARAALRGALRGGVEMYHAHREVFRVLLAMTRLDPGGVARTIARAEGERAAGIQRLARRLHDQGDLRPGLAAERAAHAMWLLASFDAFESLAGGRSLPPGEAIDLLVEIAERALLAVPAD